MISHPDPLGTLIVKVMSGKDGLELLKQLEDIYVRRSSFTDTGCPYQAAVRDGERRLVLTLTNIVRNYERTGSNTATRTKRK